MQLVVGERCALAASSGLINAAPDEASQRFLATQTLDEARVARAITLEPARLERIVGAYLASVEHLRLGRA